MSELSVPLYIPVTSPDGDWSWAARFRLPDPLPRDDVLAEIHRGVQAMRYSTAIPLDKVAEHGLSGVLIGPEGDDDAEMVQDVMFATDPSKKFGQRLLNDSDRHALRLAELNHWFEVDEDGHEIPADEEDIGLVGIVRVIMGRNKDRYGGESAFTLEEARNLLPSDTRFTTSGGYLFSDRPTWDRPYGEPAAIVKMNAESYGPQAEQELFGLAFGLSRQHRFVLEAPWGAQAFEINA